jgi:hypothetical protein
MVGEVDVEQGIEKSGLAADWTGDLLGRAREWGDSLPWLEERKGLGEELALQERLLL